MKRPKDLDSFIRWLAIGFAVLTCLPALMAFALVPSGGLTMPTATNVDDHLVYAAWMKQAMEGRFFFENRFTLDPQPGLTVHLFFWAIGNVARLTGIPLAMVLAKAGFSVLTVFALAALLRRLEWEPFRIKIALFLSCFAMGIGFSVWTMFGVTIPQQPQTIQTLFAGRAPIDVWQPEAFTFPSALTNALFMVSLWLILYVLRAMLEAKESWSPVWKGALAFGVLMNIHSYDALLITFVMIGFGVAAVVHKRATGLWIARAAVIGAGALPAVFWFLLVLRQDVVFQNRAATETFAPHFTPVVIGLSLLIVLTAGLLWLRNDQRARLGALAAAGLYGALLFLARTHNPDGYFLSVIGFVFVFACALGIIALLSTGRDSDLILSWAILAPLVIYVPFLFQRKLAMGMSIPWAIAAAAGLAVFLQKREDQQRRAGVLLVGLLTSLTSVFWLQREFTLIRDNLSTTTVHPVRLDADIAELIRKVDSLPGTPIVLAPTGVPFPQPNNQFRTPYMPDLNPFVVGLAGARTYAGHWSETPRYVERRSALAQIFVGKDVSTLDSPLFQTEEVYIIAPNPDVFPELPFSRDLSRAEPVLEGPRFRLLRVPPLNSSPR